MKGNMNESSHINHVGVTILIFIVGAFIGYYVGAAYEAENLQTTQADQSFFSGVKKKVPVTTPTTTPITTTPATTTTTTTTH